MLRHVLTQSLKLLHVFIHVHAFIKKIPDLTKVCFMCNILMGFFSSRKTKQYQQMNAKTYLYI